MKKPINLHKTKKSFLLFSFLLFCFLPCMLQAQEMKEVKGDGSLITQTIPISNFSKIGIEVDVEINYSQEKNKGNLEFTIDQNLWEYYDIYTKNDELYIKLKKEYRNKTKLIPTKSVITVFSRQLEEINITGHTEFHFCSKYFSKKLIIKNTGMGNIFANQYPVRISEFDATITGFGDILLMGDIRDAKVRITGRCNVSALDCRIVRMDVAISGNGNVEAQVFDKLNVVITGMGTVKFQGDPRLTTRFTGGKGEVINLQYK